MTLRSGIKILLFLFCLHLTPPIVVGAVTPSEISTLQTAVTKATDDLKKLADNPNSDFKAKITKALQYLTRASTALAGALKSSEATEEIEGAQVKVHLGTAQSAIKSALDELDAASEAANQEETKNKLAKVSETLRGTDESIAKMTALEKKEPVAMPAKTPADEDPEQGLMDGLVPYIVPGLTAIAGLLILGLLLYAVVALTRLRRATDQYFSGALPKGFNAVKGRQDDIAKQIDASAAVSKDINARLADVHTEIRQMSRMLQQTALANRQANGPSNYSQPAAAPVSDMPVFPISADELLRQMHGKSVVLKRDFQNDMLVSDPDGKGELVLIRDSQIADESQPLFLVPSVAQFQMRQEYYNFYEKYYECANPESGAVWIAAPATVQKVAGGWQLREKGRLEIR